MLRKALLMCTSDQVAQAVFHGCAVHDLADEESAASPCGEDLATSPYAIARNDRVVEIDVSRKRTDEPLRKMARPQLITAIFEALLGTSDSRTSLGRQEMRIFAEHTGFRGSEAEWDEEYALLCSQQSADLALGLDAKLFADLLDDASEGGCYCTTSELRKIFAKMLPEAASLLACSPTSELSASPSPWASASKLPATPSPLPPPPMSVAASSSTAACGVGTTPSRLSPLPSPAPWLSQR
eukprot:gnl/TRDRNA2_/TRDRNA2_159967_c1_seq1.p1 gnl/TRDRNA2_/TRDRNA2_159967_c1~~gnl/TRDRNA2_/TRDRNA2_159967_c1_seq1.p1  ORF type:complete len:279 (-),score=51.84 gnl/TRDRNA2_/TRDRNA2_159967_c1_seq1:550-1269(-)